MFAFSKRSLANLEGVHPDLVKVCRRAIELTEVDFILTDGHRTIEEQREFVAKGASRTMKSRHLGGFAVDYVALVAGRASYDEIHMKAVSQAFKAASVELGIPIHWGGDWKSFQDTPHIELDKSEYPDASV